MGRKNHYKFTGKKHSKKGMLSCALTAASIFAFIYVLYNSFSKQGNGSVYLGSAGILALVVAIIGFVQAVKSIKEEDTFRGIPILAVLLSFLTMGAWIAVYAAGFIFG
ncbi:MAG: hypothetical protein J6A75_13815 [Lachnospiraceae bacterium]|nr:hypothetical protein [Lachnospiraceae bacterium]